MDTITGERARLHEELIKARELVRQLAFEYASLHYRYNGGYFDIEEVEVMKQAQEFLRIPADKKIGANGSLVIRVSRLATADCKLSIEALTRKSERNGNPCFPVSTLSTDGKVITRRW